MPRTFTSWFSGVPRDAESLAARLPGDRVLLAAAATILHTDTTTPVLRSGRRRFQHRGIVVFSDQRVYCYSELFSIAFVLMCATIGSLVYAYVLTGDLKLLFAAVLPAIFLVQRRPFKLELRYKDATMIEITEFVGSWGIAFDFVVLGVDSGSIQIVPSGRLPPELRQHLEHVAGRGSPRAPQP